MSIYYLPVSTSQLVLALTVLGFLVGGVSVPLVMGVIQKGFTGQIDWQSLARLAMTVLLAVQVGCLTSILFFESKRDVGRGVLAGMVLFLFLWPVLIGSDWMRQKTLAIHLSTGIATAFLLFVLSMHAEKKLTNI